MEAGRPSGTAERAAFLRAMHQLVDRPPILADPVVLRLVGAERLEAWRTSLGDDEGPVVRRLRASIALRSRYAEDCLAEAVGHGVSQLVVLGAGLDSFAYRNPFPALRVFEVDHPATQAWKRRRLEEVGIAIPPTVAFIPVDFERQELVVALVAGGLDPTAPAFVSWLGVTVYLTRDAVLQTLAAVGRLPPGTAIVFDYGVPPTLLGPTARTAGAVLAARAAAGGEPWQTFFAPAELAGELARLCLTCVEDLGPDEALARYFHGRDDGLRPGSPRLIHATVAR